MLFGLRQAATGRLRVEADDLVELGGFLGQKLEDAHIVAGDALDRRAALEASAHALPAERGRALDRIDRLVDSSTIKPVTP